MSRGRRGTTRTRIPSFRGKKGTTVQGAKRLPLPARLGANGVFVIVLVLLGVLTWRQAGIYRNEVTFFSQIVSLNPRARDAHLNLGSALFDANRLEEGLAASLFAVEQRPDAAGAHAGRRRDARVVFGMLREGDETVLRVWFRLGSTAADHRREERR